MKHSVLISLLQVAVLGHVATLVASDLVSPNEVVTNDWHVILRKGDDELARQVASENGFVFVRSLPGLEREYHFVHSAVPARRMKRSIGHTQLLTADKRVLFAAQQTGYKRAKRGFKDVVLSRVKRGVPMDDHANNRQIPQEPTDPLFKNEWYIKNTGQAGGKPNLDLNVEAAWAMNITGRGVTTAIMDDGIDYLHPDLRENYNAEASFDFSSNDPYPYPRYTDDWFNSHGTRCAGEISAQRDNGICGVGVAYNSRIAGLRMLDQPYMTDLIEAAAMSHMPDLIDIYSASWGPTDDGQTVDGPRNATMRKLVDGVNKGRQGKGSIYVWASGDGGAADDCNCDGYAASMWTISVNSATNDGETATYDESCSSTLASTFSNGKGTYQDAGVATVDLFGKCTLKHSGTSAAAPEAAGIIALTLEANPSLTWRDMQHLIVLTSKRNSLHDRQGHHQWTINGAGLEYNHLFGYGVMDAGDIVDLAKHWVNVPDRFHCTAGSITGRHRFSTEPLVLTIDTDACKDQKNQVNYLEHVQAFITLKSARRGDVQIFLTSPMGTTSMILSRRPNDADAAHGFTKWPFMTTHMWAENPRGNWTMRIELVDDQKQNDESYVGVMSEWTLVLHGTQEAPYEKVDVNLKRHTKLAVVKRKHEDKNFIV